MKEMTRVELRRLEMRDLNAIERIERASYPTPWSRSTFASELAKTSSICVGAFDSAAAQLVAERDWWVRTRVDSDSMMPGGRVLSAEAAAARAILDRGSCVRELRREM